MSGPASKRCSVPPSGGPAADPDGPGHTPDAMAGWTSRRRSYVGNDHCRRRRALLVAPADRPGVANALALNRHVAVPFHARKPARSLPHRRQRCRAPCAAVLDALRAAPRACPAFGYRARWLTQRVPRPVIQPDRLRSRLDTIGGSRHFCRSHPSERSTPSPKPWFAAPGRTLGSPLRTSCRASRMPGDSTFSAALAPSGAST